jgi:ribonucleoside-diphosphate reductase alpha chain
VSSGIEPIYALEARRHVLAPDGNYEVHAVRDFAFDLWQRLRPGAERAPGLVASDGISGEAHLEMQAVMQPWIDNAISKTINVPSATPFDAFHDLYDRAWSRGLKGCTVFRPNPIRGEVLAPAGDTPASHCCDIEREAD